MVEARGRAAMATGALALVVAGALTAAGTRPVAPPPSLLGVSWTPQTTLYAWVAAENGSGDLAAELLDWTAAHRTASGAIPEKVTAEGEPRSVAPLTWSAANVVLAADALDRLLLEVAPQDHDE